MDHLLPKLIDDTNIENYPGYSVQETQELKELMSKNGELDMNQTKQKMRLLKKTDSSFLMTKGEAGKITESELNNSGFKSLHRVSFAELVGTMQCVMELHHVAEMSRNLVAIALDCPTGREILFNMPEEEEEHPDVVEAQQGDNENNVEQVDQNQNNAAQVDQNVNVSVFDSQKLSESDRLVYNYYMENRKIKVVDTGVEDFIKEQFKEDLVDKKCRRIRVKLIEAVYNSNGIDGPKPYNHLATNNKSDEEYKNLFSSLPKIFPKSFSELIVDGKDKIAQSIRVFCLLFLKMIYRDDQAYKTKLPRINTMETICFQNMSVTPIDVLPTETAMATFRIQLPAIPERIALTKSIIRTYTFESQLPPVRSGLNWLLMTSTCLTGFGIIRLIVASAKKVPIHPFDVIEFNLDSEKIHEYWRFDRELGYVLAPPNRYKDKEAYMYSGMYAENMRPNLKLELFPRYTSYCVGISEEKDQIRPIYPSFTSYSSGYIMRGKKNFEFLI